MGEAATPAVVGLFYGHFAVSNVVNELSLVIPIGGPPHPLPLQPVHQLPLTPIESLTGLLKAKHLIGHRNLPTGMRPPPPHHGVHRPRYQVAGMRLHLRRFFK